jgi:glycosyltransferase involved in cell wall biosynthesis
MIPNGIEVQRFESASPADLANVGVGPDRRVLLYVGRLDPQKGVDW